MSVCRYVHMGAGDQGRPELLDPVELELQKIGKHLIWLLEIKFMFSGVAANAFTF